MDYDEAKKMIRGNENLYMEKDKIQAYWVPGITIEDRDIIRPSILKRLSPEYLEIEDRIDYIEEGVLRTNLEAYDDSMCNTNWTVIAIINSCPLCGHNQEPFYVYSESYYTAYLEKNPATVSQIRCKACGFNLEIPEFTLENELKLINLWNTWGIK